jgi:hypothetical protein
MTEIAKGDRDGARRGGRDFDLYGKRAVDSGDGARSAGDRGRSIVVAGDNQPPMVHASRTR